MPPFHSGTESPADEAPRPDFPTTSPEPARKNRIAEIAEAALRLSRGQTLAAGTVLIVGLCYAVAAPAPQRATGRPQLPASRWTSDANPDRPRTCEDAVARVAALGERDWTVRVHPPFVLAGDLSAKELDQIHDGTIQPAARVLQLDYFDREPTEPITILILSSEDGFRRVSRHFGRNQQRTEYSGLYHRAQRTILINLQTGLGTVTHELTHGLAHADFPAMPEWFDEGLASLHEESEFSANGQRLLGRDNWRIRFLLEAEKRGCWKSVSELLDQPFADPNVAALDYALARYVCLYLQERGLLPAFYRKCRSLNDTDPTGRAALLKLLPEAGLDELERDFRTWVLRRP
jgi:hypothetical protein